MELRPPGNAEMLLETAAALAKAGKVNATGVPNLPQTAVIMQAYWDVFRLVSPPQWIQRTLFAVLAPVGRMLDYRSYYRYDALTGGEPEINE